MKVLTGGNAKGTAKEFDCYVSFGKQFGTVAAHDAKPATPICCFVNAVLVSDAKTKELIGLIR